MNTNLRLMTTVFLSRDGKMLMLYKEKGRAVSNVWVGSAGGHFEENEIGDAKKCVLRELKEELNLSENDTNGLELKYITIRRIEKEIRQNYYFFASLNGDIKDLSSSEGKLSWFDFSDLQTLAMPMTAKSVLIHWLDGKKEKDSLFLGIANKNSVEFSRLELT